MGARTIFSRTGSRQGQVAACQEVVDAGKVVPSPLEIGSWEGLCLPKNFASGSESVV